MIVQAFIYLILLILALYWLTCIIHFLGIPIYGKNSFDIFKAFLPFYYWFKKTEIEKAMKAEESDWVETVDKNLDKNDQDDTQI